MLASIRRLGGARLHLLTEHGRAQALFSESLACFGSAGPLAFSQLNGTSHSRPYASGMPPMEPELTLQDDLSIIARLNPQLRDVMLAHEKHQRCVPATASGLRFLAPQLPAGTGVLAHLGTVPGRICVLLAWESTFELTAE